MLDGNTLEGSYKLLCWMVIGDTFFTSVFLNYEIDMKTSNLSKSGCDCEAVLATTGPQITISFLF